MAIAAWKANWGWGEEGALLIRHTREELGLTHGARYSFSEFDHLRYDAVGAYGKGKVVKRGDVLGTVFRPGGKARYFPEVHWEVWEVEDDTEMSWRINKYKGAYWTSQTGRLIDPLYMLAREERPSADGSVDIQPFEAGEDYSEFRGFTYILPCRPKLEGAEPH